MNWFDQTTLAGDAEPAGRGDQPGLWEACPQVTRDDVTLRQKKNLILKYNCRHSGPDMESMKAVALAAKARSLADFQKAVKAYKVSRFNS